MKHAVVIDCLRTPIGRAHKEKGVFRNVRSPTIWPSPWSKRWSKRTGIDPAEIEDVVLGNTQQQGEQGFNVARSVALMAGLPMAAGGTTVNRLCGSSLQALNQAAHAIVGRRRRRADRRRPGAHAAHPDGCRTRSEPQAVSPHEPRGAADGRHGRIPGPNARHLARGARRLRPAQPSTGRRGPGGRRIRREIVPIWGHDEAGNRILVERDQCVRPDCTAEGLAALKPAFMPGMGTVTAGNSSPLNDGAAALLIMSDEKAAALGLKPLVRVLATAVVGVEPAVMGTGPVPATQKALERAGLKLADIDLIELNEAFAAQALACIRMLGLDREQSERPRRRDRHRPSAGRQRRTHRHHADPQHDRPRRRLGLATMCIGVGQGIATIFERV